jgi:cytochrome c peroxidase
MLRILSKTAWPVLVLSTIGGNAHADHPGNEQAFTRVFPGTNGRTCATCHVLDEHTTLTPDNVARRFEAADDPLFLPLDADDPSAAQPTYEHLKKGLVRVVLPLPDNMDVIDAEGNVISSPERTVFVWRGVPSIENTALSAPYQLDGRVAALPEQALAAIVAHAEGAGASVAPDALARIAAFELNTFSSGRARRVAHLLERGTPLEAIEIPELHLPLSGAERRGREVFTTACGRCHGGASTRQITDRQVHDALFFELGPDGNIRHDMAPGEPPVARLAPHDSEFLNIGFGLLTGYGQLGILPMFNASVELPRYRFRFYTDGTRRELVTDLPPIPVTASGDPLDIVPALDSSGSPIVGPSLANQWFSTDPGRAIVTGDPLDFEAFDVPQLRGVAGTAPYFHDNSAETLEDVVDSYSRFILPFPALGLPPIHPPELEGGPAESLSREQKSDLLAFLRRL